jgi:hypothetical protein
MDAEMMSEEIHDGVCGVDRCAGLDKENKTAQQSPWECVGNIQQTFYRILSYKGCLKIITVDKLS